MSKEMSKEKTQIKAGDIPRKRCPFCGGNSTRVMSEHHYAVTTPVVYVVCNICGCRGGRSISGDAVEAVKRWNKRTRSITVQTKE